MKVAVFCNSSLGFPTLQFLYSQKLLAGVVIPQVENDATADLKQLVANYNIPHKIVDKQDVGVKLSTWLGLIGADVAWVLTFPYKLPKQLLNTLPLGFFNFHFGMLPKYRGADPIFWQIKNREPNGGICIHKMEEGLDTGAIAMQAPVPLRKGETYGMHSRMLAEGVVQVAYEFLQRLNMMGARLPLTPQDVSAAQYFGRPQLKDVSIDWDTMTADEIIAVVDACNPWNKGAYAMWQNTAFKIIQILDSKHSFVNNQNLKPGTVINCSENKTIDIITVDNKALSIDVISIEEGIFTADFLVKLGLRENQLLKKPF